MASSSSAPTSPRGHSSPSFSHEHSYTQPTASSSRGSRQSRRYASHPGCVLCSIISSTPDKGRDREVNRLSQTDEGPSPSPTASTSFLASLRLTASRPSSPAPLSETSERGGAVDVAGREVVYWDEEITVYRATGKERLCSDGKHLIVAMNRHVESVYELGPSDVPTLSHMLDTARQILSSTTSSSSADTERAAAPDIRVGFVGTVMRDWHSPHSHLHAHAMAGPIDTTLPGAGFYRRNVIFGSMNWWSIEDLRAEIRESTSNNRVKSGYPHRSRPPIERVPDAGSAAGLPNAMEDDAYSTISSSPNLAQSLHPNDANHGQDGRNLDRKGKGSTVPRKPVPHETNSGVLGKTEFGSVEMANRKVSMSSNGSVMGDDDGYVAVSLEDRRVSR